MAMKRVFDIIGSIILIILLLFPFLFLCLLCRLKMGHPVFFIQTRPGRNGIPFKMIKLRTMINSHDSSGSLSDDHIRLTNFGRFLRSTSLDELPELINVLKGDMSFVGPRPLLMDYLPLYSEEERKRHDVRPGITGLAQINGRNGISWEEKFKYDIYYVNNRTMFMDIKIIIFTIGTVFKMKGVDSEKGVTMPRFEGKNK